MSVINLISKASLTLLEGISELLSGLYPEGIKMMKEGGDIDVTPLKAIVL